MLIVKVDSGLEKALKSLKKKFDKTKVVKILREKRAFEKKSVKRRDKIKKAIYIQKIKNGEE
jgi:small subunit ribosomal protein S21